MWSRVHKISLNCSMTSLQMDNATPNVIYCRHSIAEYIHLTVSHSKLIVLIGMFNWFSFLLCKCYTLAAHAQFASCELWVHFFSRWTFCCVGRFIKTFTIHTNTTRLNWFALFCRMQCRTFIALLCSLVLPYLLVCWAREILFHWVIFSIWLNLPKRFNHVYTELSSPSSYRILQICISIPYCIWLASDYNIQRHLTINVSNWQISWQCSFSSAAREFRQSRDTINYQCKFTYSHNRSHASLLNIKYGDHIGTFWL